MLSLSLFGRCSLKGERAEGRTSGKEGSQHTGLVHFGLSRLHGSTGANVFPTARVLAGAKVGTPLRLPIDYVSRLIQYKYDHRVCPMLFLAPMENLADRAFRRAFLAVIGGFDEACTEFIRIPGRSENPLGSIRGVSCWYEAGELGQVPLGVQIMGSNPELMGLAAKYLVQVRGAPRVDLNCGCPANTVTGRGAGSSLLRTPHLLGQVVAEMVRQVDGAAPVSVKLRAGFDDTSLLEDNLLAAQEAGAAFVTLHPRTRRQAYSGAAEWGLIARAVELLEIPVVGNGDVVSVERAHQLLRETGCHGLMIGRGAVHDPLIFHRIRHSFGEEPAAMGPLPPAAAPLAASSAAASPSGGCGWWQGREPELVQNFLRTYASHVMSTRTVRTIAGQDKSGGGYGGSVTPSLEAAAAAAAAAGCEAASSGTSSEADAASRAFGRLKVVMRYLFASSPQLAEECEALLRRTPSHCSAEELVGDLCAAVERGWPRSGGPTRRVLYDHMNKAVRELVVG
ncbi:hypothetical protein VOLCADRAFT_108215 [Volvox carteri f. nagariensis]|uniref:tRNA-dihydrouridine(47) synthase [NAD(P)(+)] n=1 Tax=Volvox carteri f. nagariensis TaxID=3068 RepID=D8UIY0_VOLCA|nr:uncharacterized protein VOLCADRAFT_108215 [Volvox carteri f. nagariensis]EFJ40355.1 hypothetical protein VOLCADRAFT_108215 [Volvox carteri f. nagariensis]|eukprot:XP_002958618.1 hypothetical protein VOLCADRAFT_108215 [Volvox carteri f. nagariensis]